ncbi:MAG: DUF5615 family PIN-like protein [bacterium]
MSAIPSSIRLYIDEDVYPALAVALRHRGFNAVSAQEEGNLGLTDEEQLVYAVSQNRAILTFNVGHFKMLHSDWTNENKSHKGVIISTQIPKKHFGVLLRRTLRMLNLLTMEEISNKLVFLQQFAGDSSKTRIT